MNCPICAAALPVGARLCPGCGADLRDYLSAVCQPDLLFNQALDCLAREHWSEACALLCQAHAQRPEDAGILELWVRGEYGAGNKKRAVELMTDLVELDRSPACQQRFEALVAEYDREQAALVPNPAAPVPNPAAPVPNPAQSAPRSGPKAPKSAQRSQNGFFSGGMPDFSQLSSLFPGKK